MLQENTSMVDRAARDPHAITLPTAASCTSYSRLAVPRSRVFLTNAWTTTAVALAGGDQRAEQEPVCRSTRSPAIRPTMQPRTREACCGVSSDRDGRTSAVHRRPFEP